MLRKLLIVLVIGACSLHSKAANVDVSPAEVFRDALQVSNMLSKIAIEMGVNIRHREPIAATRVSPREVYFQAATLHGKTSRLMFEFTSEEDVTIQALKADADPSDVQQLLTSVKSHLAAVAEKLNISEQSLRPEFDETKTPTDVFQLIVTLNRMTNSLLDFKFSPAESHQKITESIAIASAILSTYPNADPVFFPNELTRGKTPMDVYHQIALMYEGMIPIMTKFGKTCLILGDFEKQRQDIEPSDVYDLAVLIASQLSYVHSLMPDAPEAKESYYPGKVIPAQVYMRLSILQKQMQELSRVNGLVPLM